MNTIQIDGKTFDLQPVTRQMKAVIVSAVVRSSGSIGALAVRIMDLDIRRGRAEIEERQWLAWTTDEHRLTICAPRDGGLVVSCSKEKDPLCPTIQTKQSTSKQ
jgi:hypothetical protein